MVFISQNAVNGNNMSSSGLQSGFISSYKVAKAAPYLNSQIGRFGGADLKNNRQNTHRNRYYLYLVLCPVNFYQ